MHLASDHFQVSANHLSHVERLDDRSAGRPTVSLYTVYKLAANNISTHFWFVYRYIYVCHVALARTVCTMRNAIVAMIVIYIVAIAMQVRCRVFPADGINE